MAWIGEYCHSGYDDKYGGIVYVVILLFLRDSIGMIPWKILREKFGK